MCLAVPGKIISIKDDIAILDFGSEKRSAKVIGQGFRVNEYAIAQGGVLIMTVPEDEALRALQLYNQDE